MTRPLTDQRLDEIAARAESIREYIDLPDDTDGLAGEDVPALIAEIRRQRTPNTAGLRDRIRRAICEAEGFAWDTDMLEPDEYGDIADTVLAVLPAPAADRAAVERVRAVLEMEAVVGRSALEYRGLIASALMAAEEQPANTRPCGHDDYHDPHPWHDWPSVWCPGLSVDEQPTPPREPHPTQADMDHVLAVLDRFLGRDTDGPAAGARQDGAQTEADRD